MTPYVYLLVLIAGSAAADVVDLSCSDNATCIDHMTREFVRSLRQQKTVRLFDLLTIEPLGRTRNARSNQGPVARFMQNHAFSFDWNDLTFRLQKPEHRSDAVELEIYDGRSVKDVPETSPKKTASKVEEDEVQEKRPKRIRRRRNKKVLQALIPMVFGMKSAGTVIFAMAVVTALTIKAFLASKLALLVTVGMAVKRLYESYNLGIPATSNVLWTIARYFRILFGLPGVSPLNAESMQVPMYQVPADYQMQMAQMLAPQNMNMQMPTQQA